MTTTAKWERCDGYSALRAGDLMAEVWLTWERVWAWGVWRGPTPIARGRARTQPTAKRQARKALEATS